jgi:hypothetical protein
MGDYTVRFATAILLKYKKIRIAPNNVKSAFKTNNKSGSGHFPEYIGCQIISEACATKHYDSSRN